MYLYTDVCKGLTHAAGIAVKGKWLRLAIQNLDRYRKGFGQEPGPDGRTFMDGAKGFHLGPFEFRHYLNHVWHYSIGPVTLTYCYRESGIGPMRGWAWPEVR